MTELNLTDFFLNGMITYGPLVLGLALMLGALGLPMPIPLLGLAAGAFARQGLIDWKTLSALGLMGAVLGDSVSYAVCPMTFKRSFGPIQKLYCVSDLDCIFSHNSVGGVLSGKVFRSWLREVCKVANLRPQSGQLAR